MKKRTLIIIFATLFLFTVVGLGACFLFTSLEQKKETEPTQITESISQPEEANTQPEETTSPPKEPTTTEPVDTSGWKTYRNEEYGFQIKYPPELIGLERIFSTAYAAGVQFRLPGQDPNNPSLPFTFEARRYWKGKAPDPCKPPALEGLLQQTSQEIDGLLFSIIKAKTTAYRIVYYIARHEDVCYRFYYWQSRYNYSSLEEFQKSFSEYYPLFEQIASTFTLLKGAGVER